MKNCKWIQSISITVNHILYTRYLKAWIEIHQEEPMADWELAVTGNKVFMIDPLK